MKKITVVLLVVVILIGTFYKQQSTTNVKTHSDVQKRDVTAKSHKPILNRDNLPKTIFSISSSRDTLLKSRSGVKVMVKKNTFVTENGNQVSGLVDVELREAITAVDMVLGNMTTLSNKEILQSGGMVYINATSEGKNLSIANNRSIGISVPTDNKNDAMQIYSAELQSNNQLNWIDPQDIILKVKSSAMDSLKAMPPATSDVISDTLTTSDSSYLVQQDFEKIIKPVMPKKFKGGDTTLSLIFDTASFPELAQYRNVKFKLMDNSHFDPNDAKRTWLSIDLYKTEEEGIYIITFSTSIDKFSAKTKGSDEIKRSYKVSPVFKEGSDYKTAMEEYDKKYAQFENKKKEIEDRRLEAERIQKQAEETAAKWRKSYEAQQKLIEATSYVFSVKKLGWYNCDHPFPYGKCSPVELRTNVENPSNFTSLTVSMILNNQKVYLQGYFNNDLSFHFTQQPNYFEKLPEGETITFIATAFKDTIPYIAISKIIIDKKQSVTLKLKETTIEKIKTDLKNSI